MPSFAPYGPQSMTGPRLCDLLNYGIDIGLTDYPIYDESDRDRLNQAIVDHFYTREIVADTPGSFVLQLNRTMRERMPQINRVWHALKDHDPFTTSEGTSTSRSESSDSSTGESTSGSQTLNTNAPQVSMAGRDAMDYYDTGTGSSTTATTKGDNSSTSASSSTQKLRSGYLSDAIAAWYDGYNNCDLMVFDALEPCFSQVFDLVNDAYLY